MLRSMCRACPTESARNSSHPRHTNWKKTKHFSAYASEALRAVTQRPTALLDQKSYTANITPWNAPHKTKIHEAPCHKPHNSIVTARLRSVCQREPRLPPSGI